MKKQRRDINRIAYTVREAAEAVGVSRQQVYKWITSGELKAWVVPKSILLILHDDLMKFVRARAA